jgi:hypothetical protein
MEHSCNRNCGGCSGCAKELTLTEPEICMLQKLAQIPFWPVARKADDMTPVFLEDNDYSTADYSLILQLLEKKGLIDLDYSKPLSGVSMAAYAGYPVHGSIALTARGQSVVEILEVQGV